MGRLSDKNKLLQNNFTNSDENAIAHFLKCKDLVITKSDKGRSTVILHVKDYIVKANEKLQHNLFYQKLNVDSTARHSRIVNCCRKFQKARTIIKLNSKQTHHR